MSSFDQNPERQVVMQALWDAGYANNFSEELTLSSPAVVLFFGFVLVDLSTGVVVPTTCPLTICLITCMVYPYQRRIERGGIPVSAENRERGCTRNSVENWPESPEAVDTSRGRVAVGTPRSDFQRTGVSV